MPRKQRLMWQLFPSMAAAMVCAVGAAAQTTHLDSYHRALDIVEQSLQAHGGLDDIRAAGGFTLSLTGSFDLTTRLQGRSPFRPEPTPIAERIVYDANGERVAYDVDWYNYHSSNQILREIYDSEGRVLFVDMRNRNGGWLPRETVPDSRERVTRLLPQMLLADALAQRSTLMFAGQERRGDQQVNVVSYTMAAGDSMSISIGARDGLVASAATVMEMPLLGDTQMSWSWSGYRKIDMSLTIPQKLVVTLAEKTLKEAVMSFELGADQAAFEQPDGFSIGEPPEEFSPLQEFVPYGQRPPQVEEIASGVYLVVGLRPGFRVLFVEFEDFVLAVDAPTGWYEMNQVPPMNWSYGDATAALARKLQRAIRETVPEKPLRYVALTHHHSDHIGGLRALADAGVTFLAGEAAATVAKDALHARATLAGESWPGEVREPEIEVVRGERVISDESMTVRLIELPDGNPKADNFLMVYLPRQKLLYATAFIYPIPEAVFPPRESIPLSRYFVEWLDGSDLQIDEIYNLHGMGRVEPWQLEVIRALPDEAGAPE